MMDQPSVLELVAAVREFIEKHAMPQLQGHTAFHARVAANALAIVGRELERGAQASLDEATRLSSQFALEGSIEEMNRALCRSIRSGDIAIDDPRLAEHLCQTTLVKVAIDQPNYSGLQNSPLKNQL